MPPLKNLTGKTFGKLTVIKRGSNKGKKVYWECQCECGNIIDIRGDHLTGGHTISCGYCGKHPNKFIDITGQRFGKLTVLEKLPHKDNQNTILYKCQCDCGTIIEARSTSLRYGSTASCGSAECRGVKKNIAGKRFGKLTVIKESDYKSPHHLNTYWECKCDCGNTTIVNGSYLRIGMTQSCGCLTSKGELKINELLNMNNINYIAQKTFDTCRFKVSNRLARFDFYLTDYNCLIEYDGEQHFEPFGYDKDLSKFISTQERDAYKNQWCKDNNIPLIRIPYTKLNTLSIEDLMLETTNFRVV